MKRIAILQSNYIPWKGYFDLIASVDEFLLYDEVQYTRRDWRNRNRIKTPQGLTWLTVPVKVAGRYHQTIRDTEIDGADWAERHWRILQQNYQAAPGFEWAAGWLRPLYEKATFTHLSDLNEQLIRQICEVLGIRTRIIPSSSYTLTQGRTRRLVDLCRQAGATTYVTGPAARGYLDEALFAAEGMRVEWFDYAGFPEYPQFHAPFEHQVSIVDLLFHCADEAPRFLRSHR